MIDWDKDDIDALRFMKVDCVALGMLSCLKRAFDLLAARKGIALDLATIPAEDLATYAMIRKADTLDTFQIEITERWSGRLNVWYKAPSPCILSLDPIFLFT